MSRIGQLLPPRIRTSFGRTFAVVAGIVIVVVIVVGAVAVVQISGTLQNDVETELRASADANTALLADWLSTLRSEVTLLTESKVVQTGDSERIGAFLDQTSASDTLPASVRALHYLNTSVPRIEASSAEAFVGVNPRAEGVPWAQRDLSFTEGTVVTDAFRPPNIDSPVLAVIAPVPGQTDRALVMMVNVSKRAQTLPRTGGDTFVRVINADGTVVMSGRPGETLAQNPAGRSDPGVESAVIAAALNGSAGYSSVTTNGDREAVGYAGLDAVNWAVTTRTSHSAAFAVQDSVLLALGALLGVVALGFVVLVLGVGRPTAQALSELTTAATAVARGDIDATVPETKRQDEVGEAIEAFGSTHEYIGTVADQVEALADRRFDASVFDNEVPGELGQALQVTRRDLKQRIEEIETAREDAENARQEAEKLAEALEAGVEEFDATMRAVADGDLTRRVNTEVGNESMAEIALTTNEALARLNETIAELQTFVREVSDSVEDVCTSAEEIETTSREVASTTEAIAEGATTQNERIEDAFGELNELSATVEEITSSADEVADEASEAAALSDDGYEQAGAAVEQMEAVAESVEQVAEEVASLDEEMTRIGETVVLIDDIADQTNLLALNASIEAARARTDGGDGFDVVADEVMSLADETADRTGEIREVINTVQEATGEVVTEIERVSERVSDGAEAVRETASTLEQISERVSEANDGVQAINDATAQQATATEDVVAMMDDVSEVSRRTANDTTDVAAAAEEQSASIGAVTDQVTRLADRAEELDDVAGTFVTGEASKD